MDDWQLTGIGPFRIKWNLLDRIPLIQCPTLWLRGADSVLVKQHEMEKALPSLVRQGGAEAEFKSDPSRRAYPAPRTPRTGQFGRERISG